MCEKRKSTVVSRLILLANSFPYGEQEPYLLNEVRHYASIDEVIIFSLSVRRHQRGSARELPIANIKVVPIYFRSNLFYILNAFRLATSPGFRRELMQLGFQRMLTAKRVIRAAGHYARAEYEAHVIRSYLRKKVEVDFRDETVLYAYRFLYQPYLAGRVKSLFPKAKIVGRAHGIDLYEDRSSQNYLPGRRENLGQIDELHLVARHGHDYLTDRYPAFREKMKVSYLGTVDYGKRETTKFGCPLRLVSCSSLVAVKRVTLLAEALRLIPSHLSVEWVHYGDGDQFSDLRSIVDALPSNVQVKLMGWVENDRIIQAYREGKHDVFVNVSSSEGLPVSIMEASSFGLPSIATNVGGVSEIVEHLRTGILLSANPEPDEIAQSILKFASMEPENYETMSVASRQCWEQKFNSHNNYKEFVGGLFDG